MSQPEGEREMCCAVPIHEQAQKLRKHYERISGMACDWSNQIPVAIDLWEREQHRLAAQLTEPVDLDLEGIRRRCEEAEGAGFGPNLLVARLRSRDREIRDQAPERGVGPTLLATAADMIEQQAAEIARLRAQADGMGEPDAWLREQRSAYLTPQQPEEE